MVLIQGVEKMIGRANDKKYDLSFIENILKSEAKHIKENWILFLVCFFISRQNIIDEIFPFAVVVLTLYFYRKGISAAMLVITILAVLSVQFNYVYIIMLGAIYAFFFNSRNEGKKSILLIASYAAAVLFVSKTTILVAEGFKLKGLMLNAFETLFVFSSIILINEFIRFLKDYKTKLNIKNFHGFKTRRVDKSVTSEKTTKKSKKTSDNSFVTKDKNDEIKGHAYVKSLRSDAGYNGVSRENKSKVFNIFSEKAKLKIKEQLLWQCINVKFFEVISSNKNKICLSLTVKTEKSVEEVESAIELIVRNVCGVKLRCTERVIASPNYYVLKFKNIKRIKIRTYSASATKDGSAVSGDSFAYAGRSDRYYTVLCDGIGSGEEAFNESNGAVDLLSKFLYTDFSEEQILRTLNSILMLKFTDERFVTVDLSIMDYGSKEIKFYKAGAVQTYFISGRKIDKISGKSLPMGILDNFEYSSFKKEIKIGDIIIMVSDGVTDSINMDEKKSLDKYLELIMTKDPQTIANSILSYALRGQDKIIDDMTVLVTKVG